MTPARTGFAFALSSTIVVVALSVAWAAMVPTLAWGAAIPALFMLALMTVSELRARTTEKGLVERRYGVAGAGLLLALPLAAVVGSSAGLFAGDPSDLSARAWGVAMGLVLAAYGNVMPRHLVRYDPNATGPSPRQACLRFAGRTFVLAGLAHALVYALAPMSLAGELAMLPVAAAVLLVGLRFALARARRAPAN